MPFVEDEYVDTSDPEERDDLVHVNLHTATPLPNNTVRGSYTPRKRIKLDYELSSPISTRTSEDIAPGSAATVASPGHNPYEKRSSSPTTSTDISFPGSYSLQSSSDASHMPPDVRVVTGKRTWCMGDKDDIETFAGADFDTPCKQREPSFHVDSGDTFMADGSQDPLNLLSPTATPIKLEHTISASGSPNPLMPSISSVNADGLRVPEEFNAHHIANFANDGASTSQRQIFDASDVRRLFSPLQSQENDIPTSQKNFIYQGPTEFSTNGTISLRTPPRSSATRFSSSPLSSPVEYTAPVEPLHSGARAPSPGSSHAIRQTQPLSLNLISEPQNRNGESEDDGVEDQDFPRRYSLRARKARQLNPYEFEKRQYKLQMRHNPEAIVKIVSPRRRNSEQEREKQRTQNDTQETEWVVEDGDEDEESQVQINNRASSARLMGVRDSDTGEDSDKDGPRKWYPKEFDLSDDDLPPLPSPAHQDEKLQRSNEEHKRKKKAKFPMRNLHPRRDVNSKRGSPPSTMENRQLSLPISPTRSLRQVPASRARSESVSMASTPPGSNVSRHSIPHSEDIELDHSRIVNDDPPDFEVDDYNEPATESYPSGQAGDTVIGSDHSNTSRAGSGAEDSSNSYESSDSSALGRLREEEKKKRKALKVLRRMMPAVMVSKMINGDSAQKRSTRARSSSVAVEDDSGPELMPGHSKRKKTGGLSRDVVEVKGDTESSDPEEDDSDAPDGASSEEEHGRGSDIDDEAVEVSWHDHDFSHQYQEPGLFRKEVDLIDRMLSRTSVRSGLSKPRVRKARLGNMPRPRNQSLDIVVGSSRKRSSGRQTILPFTKTVNENQIGRSQANQTSRANEDRCSDLHSHHRSHSLGPVPVNTFGPLKKPKSKKQMSKDLKRKQAFVVPSDGKVIRRSVVNVDVDDDGFHEALAPLRPMTVRGAARPLPKPHSKSGSRSGGFVPTTHLRGSRVAAEIHDDEMDIPHAMETDTSASRTYTISSDRDVWGVPNLQKRMAKLTLDLDVPLLSSGLVFGANTYLGRQLLHDLLTFISGSSQASQPWAYSGFDFNWEPTIGKAQLLEDLPRACQLIYEWLTSPEFNPDDNAKIKQYENLMQSVCYFSVWVVSQSDEENKISTQTAVLDQLRQLIDSVQAHLNFTPLITHSIDIRALSVHWFAVELSVRMVTSFRQLNVNDREKEWTGYVVLLMRYLVTYGLHRTMEPILLGGNGLTEPSAPLRTAELWVCLIHLVPQLHLPSKPSDSYTPAFREQHPLWKLILQVFLEDSPKHQTDFEASEHIWRVIFTLGALSQFSSHGNSTPIPRLPACWELVSSALKVIRLAADPEVDQNLSPISLRKRDEYVRLVVARCYLLSSRWHWRLEDAFTMLYCLIEIFKSRNFGNLRGEDSDFPAFLRHSNLQLLTGIRRSDTVFSLYLKLVVQAARDTQMAQLTEHRISMKMMKLLSLTVPVSCVTFTRTAPPIGQELSMLYNRFSSIIVAIYLQPTVANLENRLTQARRYVGFPDADWKSKQASIRALMHVAILVRHLSLPLNIPLKWLEEMTDTLVDEYQRVSHPPQSEGPSLQGMVHPVEEKNQAIVSIQLLLGCVRRIIESSGMDPNVPSEPQYPDPALLDGPWVKRVFAAKDFTNIVTTRKEIQKLVQTFLDARAKVMPAPRRPSFIPLHAQESQESQEEYGQFDLNLDDPELIAALEKDGNISPPDENKIKDEKVAKTMDLQISPAIYRLVIQHFSDPSVICPIQDRIEDYYYDADKWVDCWVGCAAVVVQNSRRDWSHYLCLGPQSWERISDSSLRRRVGLRFMYKVLLCDPAAYLMHQDSFLELLLESIVTANVTLENEYMSLLFSIDGLRHPMLRDVPAERESEAQDFQITRSHFANFRIAVLNGIFTALVGSLNRATEGEPSLEYENQKWIGFILTMFSTLRDISEGFGRKHTSYVEFSREVFALLSRWPLLQTQPRLAGMVTWGAGLEVSGS